ncbi:MAG: tetratricopeptide repeat protein [Alphaproteobacteria bacterium]|nr:tetratricopeptide repeat protein [Alphaproteobacteria bacterium]
MQEVFDRAVSRHNAGDLAGAQKLYRRILKAEPNNPQVLNLAGVAAFQLGQRKRAVDSLSKAIALAPDYGDAHYNYGNVLTQLGRLEDAAARFREAVRLEPGHGDAHFNLGTVLLDLGRPEDALESYRKLLALGADVPELHNSIGLVLSELARWDEAAESFENAIRGRTDFVQAHCALALARMEQGRMEDAKTSFRAAITIDPAYARAHYNLGNLQRTAGQLEEAAACYERAIKADPAYVLAHNNLGLTLNELGRLAAAADSFRRAIAADRDYAPARINLANVSDSATDEANIREMARLADKPDLAADDAIGLQFALGRAFGQQGADDQAFSHFLAGNRLKRETLNYDGAAMAEEFATTLAVFDEAFMARHGNGGNTSDLPIFILGMPRSGTSLVEQILASHGDVHGAGELHDVRRIAADLPQRIGSKLPYPACVRNAGDDIWAELGGEYLDAVSRLAPGMRRVCDKMPGNFLRLGLIHLMLPNATIIHCQRDAMDTCYSCFTLLFSEGQHFAYDLAELGDYYRHYDRLMRHWHQVLPNRILDLRYEDVVGDLEGSARRLVAHCGLDWDDRCLEFHSTERAVRTASMSQVRQPIYASSLGRWRRHEHHLGPLIDALGPLADT